MNFLYMLSQNPHSVAISFLKFMFSQNSFAALLVAD